MKLLKIKLHNDTICRGIFRDGYSKQMPKQT